MVVLETRGERPRDPAKSDVRVLPPSMWAEWVEGAKTGLGGSEGPAWGAPMKEGAVVFWEEGIEDCVVRSVGFGR